jgi:hypothetical protein
VSAPAVSLLRWGIFGPACPQTIFPTVRVQARIGYDQSMNKDLSSLRIMEEQDPSLLLKGDKTSCDLRILRYIIAKQ